MEAVRDAVVPILYGGFVSVGIAYTLQVVAQKDAHPAHASILLSMQSPVAALAGWVILSESLTLRALFGCALMLVGMILSQLAEVFRPKSTTAGSLEGAQNGGVDSPTEAPTNP